MDITKEKEPAAAGTVTSSKEKSICNNDNTESTVCQEFATAEEKIIAEYNFACKKLSSKGKAVAEAVMNALSNFCRQNGEFEQAVLQSDKTVIDCIEHTVKNCGSSISDLDVYRKAVQFYFKGADVHMKLTIDLGDDGFSNKTDITVSSSNSVELSLDSLLDF